MKALIIIAHPDRRSLSHATASAVQKGYRAAGAEVLTHDLYAESFDPVLSPEELRRKYSLDDDMQKHYEDVKASSLISVVYPEWWGGPPAILKGWLDRVLRPAVAYNIEGEFFEPKTPVGLFSQMSASVFAITDAHGAQNRLSAPWRESVFAFTEVREYRIHVLEKARSTKLKERRAWLKRAEDDSRRLAENAAARLAGVKN